jgi:hypothetical protein
MLRDGLFSLLVDKNSQALVSAKESTHMVIISVVYDFQCIDLLQIVQDLYAFRYWYLCSGILIQLQEILDLPKRHDPTVFGRATSNGHHEGA